MIERRPHKRLGSARRGWLDAEHHVSFAGYHDPAKMGREDAELVLVDAA